MVLMLMLLLMRGHRGMTATAKGSRHTSRLGGVGRILGKKEAGVRERPEKMRLSLSLSVSLKQRPIRQIRVASAAAKAQAKAEATANAEAKGR